ncbi:MAG: radical SAM protein [Bacteroidota bacterium]
MADYHPKYLETYKKGHFKKIVRQLESALDSCELCPRKCKSNRNLDKIGICNTGKLAKVASYGPHHGEESCLVGRNGSGTIFFSNCNLLCNFCQNFDISHEGIGYEVSSIELAEIMLNLQKRGCHNINFVTPSHVVPQIVFALEIAISKGLNIPLIYNSSAYDKVETLQLLYGIMDIYMPDFKFMDPKVAKITCNAEDYPEVAKNVLKEMYRQVGNLKINKNGIATNGLLIRHLVMPSDFSGTIDVLKFITKEISINSFVNIMPQYRPEGRANKTPKISHSLKSDVYYKAINDADLLGIKNLL